MNIREIMDKLDGKYKIVNPESFDKIEDLEHNELNKADFSQYIGKAIYVYNYTEGTYDLIVPMAMNESNFIAGVLDSDSYVDVFKWDKESQTFKFAYTGDPYETLYSDEDLEEFKEDANNHPSKDMFDEGDIIFIAKHGTKEPYKNDSLVDPAGIYMIGTGPMSYIDDDEDDLELLPVYGYLRFFDEVKDAMGGMVDFINEMMKEETE